VRPPSALGAALRGGPGTCTELLSSHSCTVTSFTERSFCRTQQFFFPGLTLRAAGTRSLVDTYDDSHCRSRCIHNLFHPALATYRGYVVHAHGKDNSEVLSTVSRNCVAVWENRYRYRYRAFNAAQVRAGSRRPAAARLDAHRRRYLPLRIDHRAGHRRAGGRRMRPRRRL
jgi:hypothetical protein